MMAISTARIDITPTTATNPYLAGYGVDEPRKASSDVPHAPLHARCIVFWDDGHPNAIVSVDVLGLPRSMHQAIRRRVVALHPSWVSSDFVILFTHTHNGPVLRDRPNPYSLYKLSDTSLVESYSDRLVDWIVDLVGAALSAPQAPCTLDYSVAAESFSYNRAGLPYTETAVPILTARGTDGAPVALLFSYGCHPVSAGGQALYDGDYPARACEFIENATGAVAMFALGPAGDQNPLVS